MLEPGATPPPGRSSLSLTCPLHTRGGRLRYGGGLGHTLDVGLGHRQIGDHQDDQGEQDQSHWPVAETEASDGARLAQAAGDRRAERTGDHVGGQKQNTGFQRSQRYPAAGMRISTAKTDAEVE